MSAKSAVSVMRCSSTTVNRSSRARPACTRVWSGLLAAGFASNTTIAATGGSSNSVSASPRRDMLIVRAGGVGRSAGTATRPELMPPKCAARHAQDAAADVPEVARERGQREHRAHGRAGTAVPLQAEAEADRSGARVREAPPERAHL